MIAPISPDLPPSEGLVSLPQTPAGRGGRDAFAIIAWAVAGAICLAVAITAGATARAELVRPPTAAERSAAAAAWIARRWRAWPVGRVFPAALAYTTDLLSQERATRVAVSPGHSCAAALAGPAGQAARRAGCQGAIRATYLDQLQGVVYTVGVLAFPEPAKAAVFARWLARQGPPAGLRAFGPAGTGASRFGGAALQAAFTRHQGPYVAQVVAGYADGRPSAADGQRRPALFAPGRQLAGEVLSALVRPAVVRCGQPGWSC